MFIIIEGPNCCGKTSLSKILCERYNLQYIKENKPSCSGFEYYIRKLITYKDNMLVDRFHLGEMVYPILHQDGRIPLKRYQQQAIERMINNLGGTLIYSSASPKFIKNVFDTRGEKEITFEQSFIERELFEYSLKSCTIKKYIEYSPEFSQEQRESFFQQLDYLIQDMKIFSDVRKYKGNGDPLSKIMIIGDKFNLNKDVPYEFAFSDYRDSSDYLAKTLFLLKRNVYLTNSDKEENIIEEINLIRPKIIISLGKNSFDFLNKREIRSRLIPHPQYWKRFRYKEIKEYVRLFNNVIKEGC